MGQSLPIISIESFSTSTPGSADYDNDASDLYAALSEIGFAIIVGHGVVDEIVTDMRNAVKTVFDTPRDVLMQDMVVKGNYRGFVPATSHQIRARAQPINMKRGNYTTKQTRVTPCVQHARCTGQTSGPTFLSTCAHQPWRTGMH